MIRKNKCIVLSKIKYKDYDLIIRCYTEQSGIVSYLLKGVLKSKKSNAKAIYFQSLSQLHIVENCKPNQSLQYIKEVKFSYIYRTLHTDIYKSAIVIFLSEVLNNSIKEEEQNIDLYNYLESAFQYLDSETNFSNFHLLFLVKLTRYLGFQPDVTSNNFACFNLKTGVFEPEENGLYSISGANVILLKQLLGTDFDAITNIKMNSTKRQSFLNMLLLYFELHLNGFKKPNSLQVFNDVFH